MDWRAKGAVTGVKNQGACGSCWSFGATGTMEGAWKLAGHDLVSLSEQQLVDCSGEGCSGGNPGHAIQYAVNNHGIDSERDYPYTAHNGKCRRRDGVMSRLSRGCHADVLCVCCVVCVVCVGAM